MNLKYYLRGLGLGILVTALILGLAGTKKKSMTDEEIKERALELGMIENTVLAETELPDQESGEIQKPADEADEDVTAGEAEPAAGTEETKEKEPQDAPADAKAEEAADLGGKPEEVQEESQPDETETVPPEEKSEEPGAGAAQTDPEAEEQPQASPDGDAVTVVTKAFVLTVVSGDSSYSVARKLYDMGAVPSVDEYDRFLCLNGYDRGIRTGTYEIKEGMTQDEIARMLNGK